MTTLALDAATKTGLAVVRGAELLHVTGRNSPTITEARELLLALGTLGINCIAIEAAQARGATTARQGAQAQGTLRQAEWIGLWRAVCRDVFPRVPIVDVYPATWRSGIGMPSGDRKHLKACSLHMARSRWPEHLWTSDDLSDAALLGLYVELRAKP
jgi:hypothetical protein